MFLYSVSKGEAINEIAKKFDTTASKIIKDNDIIPSMPLVKGQTLVITKEHEDREFGCVKTMASVKYNIEREALLRFLPYLTYLSIRSCYLRSDGSIFAQNDCAVRHLAKENHVVPILEVLSANSLEGDWSECLSSYEFVYRIVNNVKQLTLSNGYGAVNLNLGYVPDEYFNEYVELVATLKTMLSDWNIKIFSTLGKESIIKSDLELLGDSADMITLFPKGRQSDIMDVLEIEDLYKLICEIVPKEKISMSFPMSALDNSYNSRGNCFRIEKLSSAQASRLACEKNADIVYDETNYLANFSYVDIEMGKPIEHRVCFQNLQSAYEIACMGKELCGGGVNVFNADKFYAPFWTMLSALYQIQKEI